MNPAALAITQTIRLSLVQTLAVRFVVVGTECLSFQAIIAGLAVVHRMDLVVRVQTDAQRELWFSPGNEFAWLVQPKRIPLSPSLCIEWGPVELAKVAVRKILRSRGGKRAVDCDFGEGESEFPCPRATFTGHVYGPCPRAMSTRHVHGPSSDMRGNSHPGGAGQHCQKNPEIVFRNGGEPSSRFFVVAIFRRVDFSACRLFVVAVLIRS